MIDSLLLAQTAAGDSTFLLWGLALGGIAILLFVAEIFIPTGGVIAVLCVFCVVGSVVLLFKHDASWGMAGMAAYCVLAPFALVFGLKLWSQSPLARRLILGAEDDDDEQSVEAAAASADRVRQERVAALAALIGVEGRTVTPLRPIGFVVVDGRRIDALAEGPAIDPDTPVIVVGVLDNQIKVRARE